MYVIYCDDGDIFGVTNDLKEANKVAKDLTNEYTQLKFYVLAPLSYFEYRDGEVWHVIKASEE